MMKRQLQNGPSIYCDDPVYFWVMGPINRSHSAAAKHLLNLVTSQLFHAVNPGGKRLVFGSGGKHHDCRAEAELRHMLEFMSFNLLIVHEGAIRAAQICQHG